MRDCLHQYTHNIENLTRLLKKHLRITLKMDVDIVQVHGGMEAKEKLHNLKHFSGLFDDGVSNVRILVATVDCAGCGVDNPNVYSTYFDGMPCNAINIIQPLGRSGRRDGAHRGNTNMIIAASLSDFQYLFLRAYEQSEDTPDVAILSRSEKIKRAVSELFTVLRLLFLKGACWHVFFEGLYGRPGCCSTLGPCQDDSFSAEVQPFFPPILQKSQMLPLEGSLSEDENDENEHKGMDEVNEDMQGEPNSKTTLPSVGYDNDEDTGNIQNGANKTDDVILQKSGCPECHNDKEKQKLVPFLNKEGVKQVLVEFKKLGIGSLSIFEFALFLLDSFDSKYRIFGKDGKGSMVCKWWYESATLVLIAADILSIKRIFNRNIDEVVVTLTVVGVHEAFLDESYWDKINTIPESKLRRSESEYQFF